eukprot:89737-Ditylum_brightwellii.AAC.1
MAGYLAWKNEKGVVFPLGFLLVRKIAVICFDDIFDSTCYAKAHANVVKDHHINYAIHYCKYKMRPIIIGMKSTTMM